MVEVVGPGVLGVVATGAVVTWVGGLLGSLTGCDGVLGAGGGALPLPFGFGVSGPCEGGETGAATECAPDRLEPGGASPPGATPVTGPRGPGRTAGPIADPADLPLEVPRPIAWPTPSCPWTSGGTGPEEKRGTPVCEKRATRPRPIAVVVPSRAKVVVRIRSSKPVPATLGRC